MNYNVSKLKVNEIFYSIQGEGAHAGEAAVFVRFSGCNLKCPFCDTDFKAFTEYTEFELVDKVKQIAGECRFVVLTGGEPALQITPYLVGLMQKEGFYVAVETNGTRDLPYNLDWVTVSPKSTFIAGDAADVVISRADEVKLVFNEEINLGVMEYFYDNIEADHYYLQPCDTGDAERNKEIVKACVEMIKENPNWELSLQIQKIINVR